MKKKICSVIMGLLVSVAMQAMYSSTATSLMVPICGV